MLTGMSDTVFDDWVALRYERLWPELFDPAYHWMKERGFTDGRNNHESLVVS